MSPSISARPHDPAAPATILVVDDDAGVRGVLRELLLTRSYSVLEAGDGREAVRLCKLHAINLVLLDLVMPEQEGIETLKQMQREWPDLPVVAMSGAFNGEFLKIAGHLGAKARLQKPFRPDIVLETVQRFLAK